jgi:hypothetical protein
MTGALAAVTACCGVHADGGRAAIGASSAGSVYNVQNAGAEAQHLLGLVRLPGWRVRTCGSDRALVHSSPTGQTLVLYHGAAFDHVIVTTARSGC